MRVTIPLARCCYFSIKKTAPIRISILTNKTSLHSLRFLFAISLRPLRPPRFNPSYKIRLSPLSYLMLFAFCSLITDYSLLTLLPRRYRSGQVLLTAYLPAGRQVAYCLLLIASFLLTSSITFPTQAFGICTCSMAATVGAISVMYTSRFN